jgi:hypothetical protein
MLTTSFQALPDLASQKESIEGLPPVDSSYNSRDDSPLKTMTLYVGVMLTVAAHSPTTF